MRKKYFLQKNQIKTKNQNIQMKKILAIMMKNNPINQIMKKKKNVSRLKKKKILTKIKIIAIKIIIKKAKIRKIMPTPIIIIKT